MRHQVLSEENMEVMNEVWARGAASINAVWSGLNAARRKQVRRTTVQVQMRRLERYGWLKRRKAGREFVYEPLWSKPETVADLLRSLRRRLFGGSYAEMVRALLADGDIPALERRRIRALLRAATPCHEDRKSDFTEEAGSARFRNR